MLEIYAAVICKSLCFHCKMYLLDVIQSRTIFNKKEGGCQEEMISAMCINIVLAYHQILLKIITIAAKYFECTFFKQSSENWSVRMQWIKLIDFVGNIPEKWWWTLVHKAQCFIIFYSPTSFVAVASLEFYIFPPKAQFSKHGIKKAFILPCWKGLLCHVIALLCSTFIVLPLLISSLFTNKTRPLLHKRVSYLFICVHSSC